MRMYKSIIALGVTALCFLASVATAQTTRVKGTVTDATSGETLPFVNIAFINSRIGTTTDLDGKYAFDTYYATDSIQASSVGYVTRKFAVRKDKEQVINIALEPSTFTLAEVVIKPSDENPAFEILRRVIRHKATNNREKLEAYQYESYNKVEFDLNNITEEFTQKKIFKPFAFIFDNIDSSGTKPYLPIFMTETLSDVYYRQKPKARKEYIRGTKVSGIENESISQFMGDMYQNVNIYDNFLEIFGKNFVSPISDGGKGYYNYYLTDSAFIGKYWCYKLEFSPKRAQELAFQGEVWINDTTYAVRRIEAGIHEGANLNFVQAFEVRQEYDQVKNEVWMLVNDALVVDLNVVKNSDKPSRTPVQGLFGRRTASYRDFRINEPKDEAFYSGVEEVVMAVDPLSEGKDYWEANRHVALSAKENSIYQMVDTMKSIPRFRTYIDIIQTVVTGYYPLDNFELGPYFTTYSFNQVEGNRFRLGARTSSQWSKSRELEGYVAYGTKDTEFKYGFAGKMFLSREPRLIGGASFKHDIEQLGQSVGAFREDNILSSAFRRTPNDKLTMVDEYRVYLEREWILGFTNTLALTHRTLFPRGSLSYMRLSEGEVPQTFGSITTADIVLNTRFAYKEKYVSGDFSRVSLGTKYPVLELHLAQGLKGVLQSNYDYTKAIMRVQQRVAMGPLGWHRYTITGGQVWGTLPYPLLLINAGNETFYYDDVAFNTMNFFEFINDRSATLFMEQHLEGLLFNRVPLFRRLKWREVLGFKAAIGSLSEKNRNEMELLPFMYDLSGGPYMEAAFGIENILKVLRVDVLRRLSYNDHPNTKLWAVRLKLNITF